MEGFSACMSAGAVAASLAKANFRAGIAASASGDELFVHISDETEAPLVVRSNKDLIVPIVADSTARRADARAERRLRDDAVVPYGTYQFIFADNSVSIPDEVNEQIENLWLDRHDLTLPPQFMPRDIDFKIGEAKIQNVPAPHCKTFRFVTSPTSYNSCRSVIALTQIAVIWKMEGRPRSLIVYRSKS